MDTTTDEQRDREYTQQLGAALAKAYRRESIFLTTHLTTRALYDEVCRRAGTSDIYRLLRAPARTLIVPLTELYDGIDILRDRIADAPEAGRVHERVGSMGAREVVEDALCALGTYHTLPVARREGDVVRVEDVRLLYYYGNRTAHLRGEGRA